MATTTFDLNVGVAGQVNDVPIHQKYTRKIWTNITSLPKTNTDASVDSSDVVVRYMLSNPSAQADEWTITTASGSYTISGSLVSNKSTEIYMWFEKTVVA